MLALNHRIPTELIDRWTLVDGRRVTLRPLLPQDVALEQALVRGLSAEGRYQRFFSPVRELSPALLARLERVDHARHLALVVETFVQGASCVVAEAQYVVREEGDEAEFALAVADDWRRRGLASRLLDALAAHAHGAGLQRLTGDVLATNAAMLALLRRRGFTLQRVAGDARLVHASLALAPAGRAPPQVPRAALVS